MSVEKRNKDIIELIKKDGIKAGYKDWASTYEEDCSVLNWAAHNSALEKWLKYHSNIDYSGHKVLDAGCGSGLTGKVVSEAVPGVVIYGVDASEEMMEMAKSKSVYKDLKIVDLRTTLPYPANMFDSVISSGVFCYIGPECLVNIPTVIKPGGYFVFTVRIEYFLSNPQIWRDKLKECDCEVIEEQEMPYFESVNCMVVVARKN